MSSPFRYFRKHTKVFLAVAAVLAIFIFVVGDALNSVSGSGDDRRDAGATVATWNGGSLNEAQLGSLIAQRILVNDFLRALIGQSGIDPQYELPTSVPLQGFILPSEQLEQVEMDVINTEVLSSLATQAGMTVSDDLINHYIEEVGSNKVSGEQVEGILKNIGQRNVRTNEAIVFNMLRKLMLAHFYQRTYADASMVVLPQQRWADWRKVNERISVEAAVLPVEKFLADVPKLNEAQLLAFYNDYKDFDPGRYENVGGRELPVPTPGFAVPRRVKLQYLLGSVAQRTEKLLDTVTEEEIAEYYEDNKRKEFTKAGLLGDDLFGDPDADAKPQAEAPAATEPAAEENETSSGVRGTTPFRLAAFQTAPEEANDDDAPAAEPAEATTTSDAAAEVEDAAPASDAAAAAKEPAVEYEPLEKVRDDIRKSLATDKAVEELEEVMSKAAAQVQTEYNTYGSDVANAKELKKKAPKPPAKLVDLKWLADEYGLTYEKTAPLTVRELYDTAVGKARDAASQGVSVWEAAYQTLDLYEPLLAQDLAGDYYLVTKIEDEPRRIPPFKEIRVQVEEAWRRAEAAKLAEKKAKELAAEVEKSGTPFDQFFFADRGFEVIKPTAFFSWRNYPVGREGTGTPPAVSEVPELKNVGQEFMATAFNLGDKQVAALLNFDRSAAYVIRLDRRQYTDDELKQLFLEEENSWMGRRDMMLEHLSAFTQAVEREILVDRAGLEFDEEWQKRRAERIQQRQN